MEGPKNVLMIVGMFALRLGAPLAVTLAIGYWLSHLDKKWQADMEAEARARHQAENQLQPLQVEIKESPAWQPGLKPWEPCWSLKGCSEAMRATCAAFHQSGMPCWVARQRSEGRLPPECRGCDIHFERAPLWASQPQVH